MLPHTDLAAALGCGLDGPNVAVDDEQRTDVPGVWAAGETTGIGGAVLSLAEGRIAGLSVAARLNSRTPDENSRTTNGNSRTGDGNFRALKRNSRPADRNSHTLDGSSYASAAKVRAGLREFFAAVDSVYVPPARWTERVTDDTVVCRCEEVPASAIREAVDELGAGDVRTVKLLTRAGMGWCQGRMCGPAVAGLVGCPETPSPRPFARPVPLGVLAAEPDPSQ
jgi:NAD(P)H-nitrite reductase large subunit